MDIGLTHLISAGHQVLVRHGPPAKRPAPRAGALSHPSPPSSESPPPTDRRRVHGIAAAPVSTAPHAPTFAVALIPSSIEAKFTCSSSLHLPISLLPSPLPCAPRADGKLPRHQCHWLQSSCTIVAPRVAMSSRQAAPPRCAFKAT
jgi:hypothetical protein